MNFSQPIISHLCKCCACWVSFPISVLKVCCQFVSCEIALYLVKHNFSRSLLRVGNRLIGLLFETVKGALLFMGGMTLASLQAWGHTLSGRLKLKMWQIGVAIWSAIILSNFPSRLSDPGGLSLLICSSCTKKQRTFSLVIRYSKCNGSNYERQELYFWIT